MTTMTAANGNRAREIEMIIIYTTTETTMQHLFILFGI